MSLVKFARVRRGRYGVERWNTRNCNAMQSPGEGRTGETRRQGGKEDNREDRNGRTTARQSCCAAASALVRSEPEHAPTMQLVTELMKPESWQRQESSRGSQLPKLAFVKQDVEQPVARGTISSMSAAKERTGTYWGMTACAGGTQRRRQQRGRGRRRNAFCECECREEIRD